MPDRFTISHPDGTWLADGASEDGTVVDMVGVGDEWIGQPVRAVEAEADKRNMVIVWHEAGDGDG